MSATPDTDYKTLFDILIRALASPDYWVSFGALKPDFINMALTAADTPQLDKVLHMFTGTPEECVAHIAAIEAEKRLTA